MQRIALAVVLGLWAWATCGAAQAEPRLAIKGYDAVAYFVEGKPTPGKPEFEYLWDGVRYRFASASHLDAFKSDPDRYAPQFGGLCTASLARGKTLEADPQNWTIVGGKLFLFGAAGGPAWFKKDPTEFEAQAVAQWTAAKRTGS
jgi:YHS domain-containing protein